MDFRLKSAVNAILAVGAGLAIAAVAMAAELLGLIQKHPQGVAAFVLLAVFFVPTAAWIALRRTVRCPNCNVQFNWRNYWSFMRSHAWPNRHCWNCGADMDEVERRKN
jgi:hypothetical protein